jgi:predicted GIY-YIG superfamily endonuclease
VDADGRDQDADDAVKFRSVFLTDEQVADIARGDMPSGVERFAREEADPKAFKHAVYRLYDEDMALVYVGESNNPGRRWKEHARRSPWWGEVVQDSDHMLLQWCHAATAKDAERAAKLEESHAIETELPRHNDAENGRNPLRVIRGGKGRAA